MSVHHTHPSNLSREFAMARFAAPHLASAPYVPGNSSPLLIGSMARAQDGSRIWAGMLLAAVMGALLVVSDQVIETWTDEHLLVGWVALWTVVFAALAMLAPPLRQVSAFLAGGFVGRFTEMCAQREEARMWETARRDPRVQEEIHAAMSGHTK
jgi:hypothetical protein